MHWWTSYKDLLSLISASVTVVTAIGIAWLVTRRITISTKRTEFFLAFTTRFHNVLTAAQVLEIEITQEKPDLPEGKNDLKPTIWKKQVQEVYRQYFALMFDEFYAYQHNFLDREIFTEWMKWRYIDANDNKYRFAIAGVPYLEGWKGWVKKPRFHSEHKFIKFMDKVHAKKENVDVEMNCLVLQYAPIVQRIFFRSTRVLRGYEIALGLLIGVPLGLTLSSLWQLSH